MWWRRFFSSPVWGIVGAVTFIWGFPGMLDDTSEWQSWFGVVNVGWAYFAVGGGAVLFLGWLIFFFDTRRSFFRTYRDILIFGILVIAAVTGVGGSSIGFGPVCLRVLKN